MSVMLDILRELTPLNRVFCSKGYDKAIEYLSGILPFEVLAYDSRSEYNGWVIPPMWDVRDARILKGGRSIYDGMMHPLCVIALSKQFRGKVSLEDLKKHLHYDHRYDDAIPFHFRQQYRSWDRDWGFCVPKRLYDSLAPGEYDVIIETEESEGVLKVLEYTIKGALEETFAFVGHLDHPGMSNDDLAGCAVGVELFRRLAERKLKYSYKLMLLPEIIGSEYYWGKTNAGNRGKILEGIFLEMLGTDTQLALQSSIEGNSSLELAILETMDKLRISYRRGPFRSIVGNDEHIWETYGVPMASLSRYPYPEYHCDRDSFSIMSGVALSESLEILMQAIGLIESSHLVIKCFEGNICLSNPKYDLYVDPGRPEFGNVASEHIKKMKLLMDMVPTLHRPITAKAISAKIGLEEKDVIEYLVKWVDKELLELR